MSRETQRYDLHIAELEAVILKVRAELKREEQETDCRDKMADTVMEILRKATGRTDFHHIAEAAECAANMLGEAVRDTGRLDHIIESSNSATELWFEDWVWDDAHEVADGRDVKEYIREFIDGRIAESAAEQVKHAGE